MDHEEPFGVLPGELPPQPPDELLDPRVTGAVLPVDGGWGALGAPEAALDPIEED